MKSARQIYLGKALLYDKKQEVQGTYVRIGTEWFYKIAHYECMNPFFMTVVSNSDHWMFIWSNGALTAGRKNPDHALFPYYTDDKIQDSADITGSKTIVLVAYQKKYFLWEPFSDRYQGLYNIERNIYKNIYNNKVMFEEINQDLNLSFRYYWLNSERFGFVKKSTLLNRGKQVISVDLVDGIQNLLPYGINRRFQAEYSTLADAYRKNELEPDTRLAIYSLSSIPVDRPEPSEALKATTVWSTGIKVKSILISSVQLDSFRQGLPLKQETDIRARRGAYLLNVETRISPQQEKTWYIAADVDQDAAAVAAYNRMLADNHNLIRQIEDDVNRGTENLIMMVARADGLQKSANLLTTSRHFSNVLFNISRGGLFAEHYRIDTSDFLSFIRNANKSVYKEHIEFLKNLPARSEIGRLGDQILLKHDPDLERLGYEYLPLTFSRRHGDPSRPWNWFSIDIKDEHGEKNLNYQGNWRDIFQNWEALALSFPAYIESMICKFVNASTADGYNPYRITREGFEWEVLDPADAWSHIGYWGDHQIIYLLKLMELSQKYHPGKLQYFLTREIFVYANVPYRIKSYREILTDPHHTVDFDQEKEKVLAQCVESTGSDGKIVRNRQGQTYRVNMTEKLLVPVLSKVSNFILEAGIWMNTQRPEWNDANNALVGNGASMVTLYYLRRHLNFCRQLFKSDANEFVSLSAEVADWLTTTYGIMINNRDLLKGPVSDQDRKKVLDQWGQAGSDYRLKIYDCGFSGDKKRIRVQELSGFCDVLTEYLDHSIRANRRKDQLYHAYNLIKVVDRKSITIRCLYEMLEGQTAILNSGYLSAKEAIQILQVLRTSSLYRADQHSYILYPDRSLPRFIRKNLIPHKIFKQSKLLQVLITSGDKTVVQRDVGGGIHFNGAFRNALELKQALKRIQQKDLRQLADKESDLVLKIYEDLFDHQSFTGRSGTFYKYEGLGCIYWHMVSKFLLAAQENYFLALRAGEDDKTLTQLKTFYYDIRSGLGLAKSPKVYGGFPTDPYSHTPAHIGAQQPGMTGQVKEDIITRFGELGVEVHEGKIRFRPGLIRTEEFLTAAENFTFYNIRDKQTTIKLERNCLAFTFGQVPFVYHLADEERIVVTKATHNTGTISGLTLDEKTCNSLFNREGKIDRLDVFLKLK